MDEMCTNDRLKHMRRRCKNRVAFDTPENHLGVSKRLVLTLFFERVVPKGVTTRLV